jgi:hypothetical protein
MSNLKNIFFILMLLTHYHGPHTLLSKHINIKASGLSEMKLLLVIQKNHHKKILFCSKIHKIKMYTTRTFAYLKITLLILKNWDQKGTLALKKQFFFVCFKL